MIDLTEKSLPNTIQVQGRDFSIHTDFRIWMRFCIEFQRWKNAGCRGVLDIAYLFSVEPPAFYCVEDYPATVIRRFITNMMVITFMQRLCKITGLI